MTESWITSFKDYLLELVLPEHRTDPVFDQLIEDVGGQVQSYADAKQRRIEGVSSCWVAPSTDRLTGVQVDVLHCEFAARSSEGSSANIFTAVELAPDLHALFKPYEKAPA